MDATRSSDDGTTVAQTGNVDTNGDIVGALVRELRRKLFLDLLARQEERP